MIAATLAQDAPAIVTGVAAALFAARSAAMNRLGYALIGLMVLTGLVFWQGPISGLSMAAMVLIALARMQPNELHLRGLLIAGGLFWVAHDFLGEAWIALAADIGALVIGGATLFFVMFRVTVEWRVPGVGPVPAVQG
jgi:hypothetical protein